jgi:hypothetical protein
MGCASIDGGKVSSHGDSSASAKTGDIVTTTTTYPDGTVEVTETCTGCAYRETVGGKGGSEFYKTLGTVVSTFVGIASIVVMALR